MSQPISLYYRNVMADRVGADHGLTRDELAHHADQIRTIVEQENQKGETGKLPFRKLPHNETMRKQAVAIAEKIRPWCKNFVVLGIGGSALGNIALQTALNPPYYNMLPDGKRPGPRLFVMDNVDPVQFQALLNLLADDLDKTVFNVISKSGETAETASQMLIAYHMIVEKLGRDKITKHIVFTTDPKSGSLRSVVNELGDCMTLEVPDGVGGRFSVLSHVGLLSAAVCGIDTAELLAGARDMEKRVSDTDLFKNPAAMYALIQFLYYQHDKKLSVMFPYSYQLMDVTDWYRQLWAESLGKNETLDGKPMYIGPTPIKALGTTDQHSQVQLYREGPNDKVFTFLQVDKFSTECTIPSELSHAPSLGYLGGKSLAELINAEKLATEYALMKSNRPCMTLHFPAVNANTVGQFIYLFEVATSIAGALFSLNTYNQPAVELGKQATFALMGRAGYEKLAAELRTIASQEASYTI